jgi:hypothetical protein
MEQIFPPAETICVRYTRLEVNGRRLVTLSNKKDEILRALLGIGFPLDGSTNQDLDQM